MSIQVVQIVEDLGVGGLERVIQRLAIGLPKKRYDVQVWCLTKGGVIADELRAAGVKVEVLGMGKRCTFAFLFRLVKKMKDCRVEILHAHGYSACTIGRAAAFLANVPVMIAHVHSMYWNYTRRQLFTEKVLSLITHKIICCSEAVARFVTEKERVVAGRVAVVYNGVPDLRRAGDGDARAALGLCPEDFSILVAASFSRNKGHSCFLSAISDVLRARPRIKVFLAGEGPLKRELELQAEKLGITGNVVFCGVVRDIGALLSAVDVLVLPSVEREGLPIAVLEAMSAGKPVIASRIGGIPEAVSDGKTGLLIPPRDSAALAAAILALDRDRTKLRESGLAARVLYEQKFTLENMIAGVERVYGEFGR